MIDAAIQKLDDASESVKTAETATVLVNATIEALNAEIATLPPAREPRIASVPDSERDRAASRPPTVQQLNVDLRLLGLSMWVVWGLVTWVVGIGALLATNYGFGVGADYIKCFLWGLGVQTAGQQLQQLTPSSVSTAFSVTLPK